MSDFSLFHNPACSKSRAAVELLESRGIQADIIHYLDTPPTTEQLHSVLKKLGLSARELIRNKESLYQELGLDDDSLNEADLIAAMVQHPRLIERPILIHNDRAVIGRPTEKLLELLP